MSSRNRTPWNADNILQVASRRCRRLCYAGSSMSGDTKCTIATVLVAQAVVVVTVLVTLQTSLQRLGAQLEARRPPAG